MAGKHSHWVALDARRNRFGRHESFQPHTDPCGKRRRWEMTFNRPRSRAFAEARNCNHR